MASGSPSRLHVVSRIAAGTLGGYAFTWGCMAISIAALFAVGKPFHDAEALGTMLGFLLFLGVFCWAFVAGNLARVWAVLAGGGALMAVAAWLVQRAVV